VEESIRMTEDRDKWRKYVMVWPTLGSRTAKEQNRTYSYEVISISDQKFSRFRANRRTNRRHLKQYLVAARAQVIRSP